MLFISNCLLQLWIFFTKNHLHCAKSIDSNSIQSIEYNLEEKYEEEQEVVERAVTPKHRKQQNKPYTIGYTQYNSILEEMCGITVNF